MKILKFLTLKKMRIRSTYTTVIFQLCFALDLCRHLLSQAVRKGAKTLVFILIEESLKELLHILYEWFSAC